MPVGCPAVTGEGYCHPCAGGWPGTKASSEKIIESAQKGVLKPEKMGCGMLEIQARILNEHFSKNGNKKP